MIKPRVIGRTLELSYHQVSYETSEDIDVTDWTEKEIQDKIDEWEEEVREFREGDLDSHIEDEHDWDEYTIRFEDEEM